MPHSAEQHHQSPTSSKLDRTLGPVAREIIHRVEVETRRPVVLRSIPRDIHGTYARIEYATESRPHVISIVQNVSPFADALIAHECLHAIRFFAMPLSDRYLGFVEKEHKQRAAKVLVPRIQEHWREIAGPGARDLPQAPQLASIYHEGIVGQLINFPPDLRIETQIREEYPQLASVQEATLRANIAELEMGLEPPVEETIPPYVRRTATTLNVAYCSFIARLLDKPSLARAHLHTPFATDGQELADRIWETRFGDYNQDRRDTNNWAKRFNVADWFCWRVYDK